MRRGLTAATALAAAFAALPAAAQDMERSLMRCAEITDESARLACYDDLTSSLGNEAAQMVETRRTEARARKEEAVRQAQRTAEEAFGYELVETGQGFEARDLESISTTITDAAKNSYGQAIVVLANGHVWRTEEPERRRFRPGTEISIERSFGNGYRLNVGSRRYAVERIR